MTDGQLNGAPIEVTSAALRCPSCGSLNITYGVSATVYYQQSGQKGEAKAHARAIYYNTFDTVEEAECGDCGHTEGTSHGVSNQWWEE